MMTSSGLLNDVMVREEEKFTDRKYECKSRMVLKGMEA